MADEFIRTNDHSSIESYKKNSIAKSYLTGDTPDTLLRFDYTPRISKHDIDNGSIVRYFCRMANQNTGEIVEISQQQYLNIKDAPLYKAIFIPWRIRGSLNDIPKIYIGVENANSMAVADGDLELPGLKYKLNNLLKFYQGV